MVQKWFPTWAIENHEILETHEHKTEAGRLQGVKPQDGQRKKRSVERRGKTRKGAGGIKARVRARGLQSDPADPEKLNRKERIERKSERKADILKQRSTFNAQVRRGEGADRDYRHPPPTQPVNPVRTRINIGFLDQLIR